MGKQGQFILLVKPDFLNFSENIKNLVSLGKKKIRIQRQSIKYPLFPCRLVLLFIKISKF